MEKVHMSSDGLMFTDSGTGDPATYRPDMEMLYIKEEKVDHPAHYNQGNIEAIDVIEDWKLGFHLGNCVKYIARCGHKDDPVQELEKARWYLDRKIAKLKREMEERGA